MNGGSTTVDGRSLAIAVLSVTACILFVGLMLLQAQPAQAIGMNDSSGDFKMLTQQIMRTFEHLVVIDAAAKRVIFYRFDTTRLRLEIVAALELDQLPKPDEPADPQQAPRRRRP